MLDVCVIDVDAKSWEERGCQHHTHIIVGSSTTSGVRVGLFTEIDSLIWCCRLHPAQRVGRAPVIAL